MIPCRDSIVQKDKSEIKTDYKMGITDIQSNIQRHKRLSILYYPAF